MGKGNPWTEEEIQIIKDNYDKLYDKDLAVLIPNHSISSIATKRKDLGLHNKNPFRKKYCFDDVVHEIEKRGYELLSNSDDYINAAEQTIKYICPMHRDKGIQYTSLGHLLENKGCIYCGYERTISARTKPLNEFEQRAKELCEEKNFEYIGVCRDEGNHVMVEFICHTHIQAGVQKMRIGNMGRENIIGCKYCVDTKKYKFSTGETKIKTFLDMNNIEYVRQYCFDNCCDKTYLPFDFYIPNLNLVIEYDGQHHYYPVQFNGISFNDAENDWIETLTHDLIKDEFCKENNIDIIRIPFWEQKHINTILENKLIA